MVVSVLRLGTALVLALGAVGDGDVDSLQADPARPADLTFAVAVEKDGDALQVRGTVGTTRATPVAIAWGGCPLRIRLYRTANRQGDVVWDSHSPTPVCRLIRHVGVVSAAKPLRLRFAEAGLSGETLAAEVPAGTYFATASIWLSAPSLWSSEMPAGSLAVVGRR